MYFLFFSMNISVIIFFSFVFTATNSAAKYNFVPVACVCNYELILTTYLGAELLAHKV